MLGESVGARRRVVESVPLNWSFLLQQRYEGHSGMSDQREVQVGSESNGLYAIIRSDI
jgi:hypothetical protein